MCGLSILSMQQLRHLPEMYEGKGSEKEGPQREKYLKCTWAQLKCQPAPPRTAHWVRTRGKKSELLEPIPYEFTASWM